MLSNIKKRKGEGFTIIEVLIVLAIAGLILLIVFLAVPALQRNARNTQRKNDASAVLGSVQEYADNNGGGLPSVVTVDTTTNTAYMCSSSPCAAANGTPAKVGFFNATATSVQFATTVPTLSSTSDTLYVMKSFSCSGNTPQPGSQRSVIVYYAVEPNATPQCVGS